MSTKTKTISKKLFSTTPHRTQKKRDPSNNNISSPISAVKTKSRNVPPNEATNNLVQPSSIVIKFGEQLPLISFNRLSKLNRLFKTYDEMSITTCMMLAHNRAFVYAARYIVNHVSDFVMDNIPYENTLYNTACFLTDNLVVGSTFGIQVFNDVGDMLTQPNRFVQEQRLPRITCVAQINDDTVVSGSVDGTVQLWNYVAAAAPPTLTAVDPPVKMDSAVSCIAFHGTTVVSGSVDGTVQLWNYAAATLTASNPPVKMDSAVSCIAMDGTTVVSGSVDGTVQIWNVVAAGAALTANPPVMMNSAVSCVAIHGTTVVSGSDNGTVQIWNVVAAAPPLTLISSYKHNHNSPVTSISYNDTEFASGSTDGKIYVYRDNSIIETQEVGSRITYLSLGNTPTPPKLKKTPKFSSTMPSLKKSALLLSTPESAGLLSTPESAGLLSAPESLLSTPGLLLSTPESAAPRTLVATIQIQTNDIVPSVAFSPDDTYIAASINNDPIHTFNIDGTNRAVIHNDNTARTIAFNRDGTQLVASYINSNSVVMYDTANNNVQAWNVSPHGGAVNCVAFNENYVASGSNDSTVKLLNITTGLDTSNTYPHPDHQVKSVALNRDYLAAGYENGDVKIWNILSGTEHDYHHVANGWVLSVIFKDDNTTWLSCTRDGNIGRCHLNEDGSWTDTSTKLNSKDGVIISVAAFSPDGNRVVVGYLSGDVIIYNVETGDMAYILQRQPPDSPATPSTTALPPSVWSVAFSQNGNMVASGIDDSICIWNLPLVVSGGGLIGGGLNDFKFASISGKYVNQQVVLNSLINSFKYVGSQLFYIRNNDKLCIYDDDSKRVISLPIVNYVNHHDISDDGSVVLLGTNDIIYICQVDMAKLSIEYNTINTNKYEAATALPGTTTDDLSEIIVDVIDQNAYQFVASPSGTYIAVLYSNTVQIFNRIGEKLYETQGGYKLIKCYFIPDETRLAIICSVGSQFVLSISDINNLMINDQQFILLNGYVPDSTIIFDNVGNNMIGYANHEIIISMNIITGKPFIIPEMKPPPAKKLSSDKKEDSSVSKILTFETPKKPPVEKTGVVAEEHGWQLIGLQKHKSENGYLLIYKHTGMLNYCVDHIDFDNNNIVKSQTFENELNLTYIEFDEDLTRYAFQIGNNLHAFKIMDETPYYPSIETQRIPVSSKIPLMYNILNTFYGKYESDDIKTPFDFETDLLFIDKSNNTTQNLLDKVFQRVFIDFYNLNKPLNTLVSTPFKNQVLLQMTIPLLYKDIPLICDKNGSPIYMQSIGGEIYDLMGMVVQIPERTIKKFIVVGEKTDTNSSKDYRYVHFDRTYDSGGLISKITPYSNTDIISEEDWVSKDGIGSTIRDTVRSKMPGLKSDIGNMSVYWIYYLKRSINQTYYK